MVRVPVKFVCSLAVAACVYFGDPGQAVSGFDAASVALTNHDYARASQEWIQPANKGHPYAQYNLGLVYYRGLLGRADHKTAFTWFEQAAKRGVAAAQIQLAQMYQRGEGTEADFAQAYFWYAVAVPAMAHGPCRDLAVRSREAVAARLNRSQITDALARGLEFSSRQERVEQSLCPEHFATADGENLAAVPVPARGAQLAAQGAGEGERGGARGQGAGTAAGDTAPRPTGRERASGSASAAVVGEPAQKGEREEELLAAAKAEWETQLERRLAAAREEWEASVEKRLERERAQWEEAGRQKLAEAKAEWEAREADRLAAAKAEWEADAERQVASARAAADAAAEQRLQEVAEPPVKNRGVPAQDRAPREQHALVAGAEGPFPRLATAGPMVSAGPVTGPPSESERPEQMTGTAPPLAAQQQGDGDRAPDPAPEVASERMRASDSDAGPSGASRATAPQLAVQADPGISASPRAEDRPGYYVQVMSLRSREAAVHDLERLKARHVDLLEGHATTIRTARIPGRGTYFRVFTGPFVERSEANALCAALKERKQDCLVVRTD